jgi:hypothetical protein
VLVFWNYCHEIILVDCYSPKSDPIVSNLVFWERWKQINGVVLSHRLLRHERSFSSLRGVLVQGRTPRSDRNVFFQVLSDKHVEYVHVFVSVSPCISMCFFIVIADYLFS